MCVCVGVVLALQPRYNTVTNLQRCGQDTTLRPNDNTVAHMQHRNQTTTLQPRYNTLPIYRNCGQDTTLRPNYNTAAHMQHRNQTRTLQPRYNTLPSTTLWPKYYSASNYKAAAKLRRANACPLCPPLRHKRGGRDPLFKNRTIKL